MLNRLKSILKPRKSTGVISILAAIIGVAFILANYRHNNKYNWRPVALPFQVKAGQSMSGSFTAELDEAYEIELEFHMTIPVDQMKELVMTTNTPSPLDIVWEVRSQDDIVAKGTSRDYLYIVKNWDSKRKKIMHAIFNIPYYQGLEGKLTSGRGIGLFKAKAGQRYDVKANVGTTISELDPANPVFNVRLNRQFARTHFRSMIQIGYLGIILVGLSPILFSWWILTVIAGKFWPDLKKA